MRPKHANTSTQILLFYYFIKTRQLTSCTAGTKSAIYTWSRETVFLFFSTWKRSWLCGPSLALISSWRGHSNTSHLGVNTTISHLRVTNQPHLILAWPHNHISSWRDHTRLHSNVSPVQTNPSPHKCKRGKWSYCKKITCLALTNTCQKWSYDCLVLTLFDHDYDGWAFLLQLLQHPHSSTVR